MMPFKRLSLALTPTILLLCSLGSVLGQTSATQDSGLPASWTAAWRNPPAELRPMQIAHGVPAEQANDTGMTALKDLGLGGIVCNVNFSEYLVSEAHWKTLAAAVEACRKAGLVVWIYDEEGYPSAAAGGLVIKENRDYEALALTYDPSRPEPFVLRPAYEHTHASNNYHAARRCPNLIDEQAIRCFIDVTHQAYFDHLKDYFGTTIKAFFTDEPSLMAVNIGPLPDDVRTKVRVVDPLDPNVKPLPSVPWVRDLPERYRERYNEDILSVRRSLFEGTSEADRRVRRQFWSLIADLTSQRYFGQIRQWTKTHNVASSGHTLWEETPLHQVPLEGNALKALMQMDIPGLDMLSSDPEAVIYSGWLTAMLPASAAIFNGGRRVMTEVSDFSQTMAGTGPASLPQMQATAAWQAALGVTEFTLYYGYHQRQPDEYRRYCEYVGRLNAVLREAKFAPRALLYYPIYDLWPEYLPVAEKLTQETQSKKLQEIVNSFQTLGQRMIRRQVPFAIVDHELLAGADVRDGNLWIGGYPFAVLVLPAGTELPESAAAVVNRFKAGGGKVLADSVAKGGVDFDSLATRLSPSNERIVVGRFSRDGRDIHILVNVAAQPYTGTIALGANKRCLIMDPATGRTEQVPANASGEMALTIPARSAVLLISL